jgi:hypothetical protein
VDAKCQGAIFRQTIRSQHGLCIRQYRRRFDSDTTITTRGPHCVLCMRTSFASYPGCQAVSFLVDSRGSGETEHGGGPLTVNLGMEGSCWPSFRSAHHCPLLWVGLDRSAIAKYRGVLEILGRDSTRFRRNIRFAMSVGSPPNHSFPLKESSREFLLRIAGWKFVHVGYPVPDQNHFGTHLQKQF